LIPKFAPGTAATYCEFRKQSDARLARVRLRRNAGEQDQHSERRQVSVENRNDAIRASQKTLWEALRVVAEPGDAAAFSALLSGAYRPAAGERVGVVISGGNTAAVDFGG
jgi:hypothetical protein